MRSYVISRGVVIAADVSFEIFSLLTFCTNTLPLDRFILLLWSLGGNFFSAWTLADCRFLYVDSAYLPTTGIPDADNGSSLRKTRYTGYVGLFTAQTETTETIESIPDYSNTWTQCEGISGEITDELDLKFRLASLMGVIGLTCGGVASLVLIFNFCMEACCATPGVQYGLGVMYAVAVATQGLTFLGIDGRNCRDYGCVMSSSATWSILACCLYFIALVHAFIVPFPGERICSSEVCCPCCGNDKDEAEEEEDEEEFLVQEEDDDDDDADLGTAAVAGAVAATGGAAIAVASADDDNEVDEVTHVEPAVVDGVAGALATADDANSVDDAEKDLKASVSAVAAAASEGCATMASNVIGSAIAACAPAGGADEKTTDGTPV